MGEEAGGTAKFYADLYVGLYYEACDRDDESLSLVSRAAVNPAARKSYMGDVARVHLNLRKKNSLIGSGPGSKCRQVTMMHFVSVAPSYFRRYGCVIISLVIGRLIIPPFSHEPPLSKTHAFDGTSLAPRKRIFVLYLAQDSRSRRTNAPANQGFK